MKRPKKPIRIFYSTLSNRLYASNQYREESAGLVTITGDKYDVTNEIAGLIEEHDITFTKRPKAGEEGSR